MEKRTSSPSRSKATGTMSIPHCWRKTFPSGVTRFECNIA